MHINTKFILQTYLLPLLSGAVHCAITASFNSLFGNQTLEKHIVWGIAGFVGGFLIGLLIQKTTTSFTKRYQYPSQFFIFLSLAIFTQFFVCPFFATVFIPWKETNLHAVCCETPLDYGAKNYESVKFTMTDEIVLSGWYVSPDSRTDSVIILIHGHYNDRRGTQAWAKYLIAAGYGVFMYDQRGNGESTGEMDFTANMYTDLLTLMDKIAEKSSAKHLGVVGLSMGAHTAINALDLNQTKFSAIWLDGLSPQSVKDLPDESSLKDWFFTRIDEQLTRIVKWRTGKTMVAPRAVTDILASIKNTKIMLVAGGLEVSEGAANRHFSTLSNDHIHSWIMQDGHHLTGPYKNSDEYRKRLVSFFDDAFKVKEVAKN